MQLTIGMRDLHTELIIDVDGDGQDTLAQIENAMKEKATVTVADSKGDRFLLDAPSIRYVRASVQEQRKVGFGISLA